MRVPIKTQGRKAILPFSIIAISTTLPQLSPTTLSPNFTQGPTLPWATIARINLRAPSIVVSLPPRMTIEINGLCCSQSSGTNELTWYCISPLSPHVDIHSFTIPGYNISQSHGVVRGYVFAQDLIKNIAFQSVLLMIYGLLN